jgi:hypothetical protein
MEFILSCLTWAVMPTSSTERRHRIGDQIRRRGVELRHPCSHCRQRGVQCVADSSTGTCAECYTFHRKCNLVVPSSTWTQLVSEREQLEQELERVEEERRQLQKRLRDVVNNERRFLSREMASIEEMEALEAADAEGAIENGPVVDSGAGGSSLALAACGSSADNPLDLDAIDLVPSTKVDLGVQGVGPSGGGPIESADQIDFGDVAWLDWANWDFVDETFPALEDNPFEGV